MKYDEFEKLVDEKCGLKVKRMEVSYNESDTRCWTAIIGHNNQNILATYHVNKTEYGTRCFDILSSRNPSLEIPENEVFEVITNLLN